MKKSAVLAGSIVLVAVAYTGAAWYVGMEAEKTIQAAIERANDRVIKTLGPDLGSADATVTIDTYQRGVFSSDVRYTFVMQDGDERIELAMQDHMQHGPFPWDLVKQGEFIPLLAHSRSQLVDTETVRHWFDAARGAMPLSADTRIGFGGQGTSEWEFAPLEWALEEDRLSFSGGRVRVDFSNDFRDSDAEGNFDSLVLGGMGEGSVSLQDIHLNASTRTATDDTVQVRSKLQAAALSIENMADDDLTIEKPAVSMDSTQKGDLLDATLRYDFARVLLGDIDLGSMSLGGKVARFNFDAFAALLSEYEAIEREHGAEADGDFDITPEDEARLLTAVAPVLESKPQLAIEPVSWRNDKGETLLTLTVALRPVPQDDTVDADDALAGAVEEARFQLVISRPMLLQAISSTVGGGAESRQIEMLAAMMFDGYIDRLEQEGLVRRDGDQVLVEIVSRGGEVDVNGQSMGVEEFIDRIAMFWM